MNTAAILSGCYQVWSVYDFRAQEYVAHFFGSEDAIAHCRALNADQELPRFVLENEKIIRRQRW